MVPALLDTFTCQGFFKRRALLDLLTELAGALPAFAVLPRAAVLLAHVCGVEVTGPSLLGVCNVVHAGAAPT
jgi:hypothetical protein